MRKQTAAKVADLLGLTEVMLRTAGRPRKLPGKPRPEAAVKTLKGLQPIKRVDRRTDFVFVDKVSLPGAFKIAANEQGYSRHVREIASFELRWAWFEATALDGAEFDSDKWPSDLTILDNEEMDTRELLRAARRARRLVERENGLS